jgi:hypothetical protein
MGFEDEVERQGTQNLLGRARRRGDRVTIVCGFAPVHESVRGAQS